MIDVAIEEQHSQRRRPRVRALHRNVSPRPALKSRSGSSRSTKPEAKGRNKNAPKPDKTKAPHFRHQASPLNPGSNPAPLLMAHAYTPGLQVAERMRFRTRRRRSHRGESPGRRGPRRARDVVAQRPHSREIQVVNVTHQLGVSAGDVPKCTIRRVGKAATESAGEDGGASSLVLRAVRRLFGWFPRAAASKEPGTIASISNVTGQVLLRGPRSR